MNAFLAGLGAFLGQTPAILTQAQAIGLLGNNTKATKIIGYTTLGITLTAAIAQAVQASKAQSAPKA